VVVGDETYPALLAEALRNGHVTEPEAERRYLLHQKVARWLEMQGRA
jgi:hypothetical protein